MYLLITLLYLTAHESITPFGLLVATAAQPSRDYFRVIVRSWYIYLSSLGVGQ